MHCVSLYTGCGGLDLGFSAAGFETIWANDISSDALTTYKNELIRQKKPLPEIHCGDIRLAPLPPPGSAVVVIGGPPCQGFSVAGRMDPEDPRSKQVWEYFKVVEHLRPRAFVMENVLALGTNNRWQQIRRMLIERGESLGYGVKMLLLNSADYGVPQLRERMFLVGIRDGMISTPLPDGKRLSIRAALSRLPAYGSPGNDSICKAKVTTAKTPVMRKSPFAGMLFNGQGRPVDVDAPAPTLPASMGGNRTPIIDQETLESRAEPWVVSYHRYLTEGGKPGGSVPSRLRRLTVEEAACLQGFPEGMDFSGSQCSKFKQIGNSVPPALGGAVAREVISALERSAHATEWRGNQSYWVAEEPTKYKAG